MFGCVFSFFFSIQKVRTRRRRNIRGRPLDGKSKPAGLPRCRLRRRRHPDHRQPTVILYNTRDFGVSSNKPVVNHRSLIKMNGPPEVGEQTKVFARAAFVGFGRVVGLPLPLPLPPSPPPPPPQPDSL